MNVSYLFVLFLLQLKPVFSVAASYSNELMLYNKILGKCLTLEVDRITVKSCDVHSQHQVWRWTPFSQLQNSLTLECVSAPEGAVYGDPLQMAKCDQYNASQKWNWQESSIVLLGETLRFNCYSARAGGPVELYNVVSNYSRWEDYEERNLNDETEINDCPKVCQNDGLCIPQNSSRECYCPCGKTGDTCEAINWCPDVKFSKVGCLPRTQMKPQYFSLVLSTPLEELACDCAKRSKENGLKYFTLGETDCTGYSESEISVENISPSQCQKEDNSDCGDSDTLPACYGRAGFHYVYELSLAEQLSCEEEIRDCSDYDYIVRATDSPKDLYFGPILNAFPSGQPFSFCIWMKVAYYVTSGHVYMIISYSRHNRDNYFCVTVLPGSTMDSDSFRFMVWMDGHDLFTPTYSRPGGIFNNWHHLCINYDPNIQTLSLFVDGEFLADIQDSHFKHLDIDGKLIIGRDQDSYGNSFGSSDMYLGDVSLLNVWDHLITPEEVQRIYSGPGTERGNFLAWTDIKKYVHGYGVFRDNPVLKFEGGGCRWEQRDCNEKGVCKGGLFRCPCSSSLTAPRSCLGSDIYETKPCSDNNYYLEFPSTYTGAQIKLDNFILHRTWRLTVCVWIKFPPGSTYYHSVVYIGVPADNFNNFHLVLRSDQMSFAIHHTVWYRTETYADNRWFHLCAAQDHKTLKMYKDGVNLGDKANSVAEPVYGHNEIIIGNHPTQSNKLWSFIGSMAHLNIWDKALSSDTITSMANGGKIYVGNLFGWPDLIKYAVPGSITVRRPSPVMTWSDADCQWSKDTCVVGEICNNAKYVCPPLQLNEVLPHSCSVSGHYEMYQDNALKPHLVVNLLLVSRNFNTITALGIEYASIFVNDYEHKLAWYPNGISMEFVVLNALTGSFITKFGCSVLSDSTCGDIINANLNKIRIERIMLMVVSDSPGPHFESAIPAMRSTFGEELHITSDLEQRQPFAMIGYSGFNDVSWRESKILPVSSGQSVIKSAVPLLRESCLDHLYMGERKNGKYFIYPRGGEEMHVYCDFTTNGGGWTAIQRRNKGATAFPVSLAAYENGFGSVDGEFWLGNKKIHRLGEGQMLAIAYDNSSSFTYDLYHSFYVDGLSSALRVGARSGTAAQSFIDTNGADPRVFAAPKGLEPPSSCLQPSDGGWWFAPNNCDGNNLNAKKQSCGESWLGTEMLFRPQLPSQDIVIKEISMKMTYQDGMDACLNDDLRLCSSMEICRNGMNVTGGSVRDIYWVPIADYYNRWINIGSENQSRLCEIDNNPDWGTDGVLKPFKGKAYCCKHYTTDYGGVTEYIVPKTYTYMEGMDECAKKRQRLCTFKELCPDGNTPVTKVDNENAWARVLDRNNEWISVGNYRDTCLHHSHLIGSLPWWGDTDSSQTYKRFLYCCPLIYEGRVARTWKYDLRFNGNLSYVHFPKITPLPKATVCWWMLLNVRQDKWKTVFSLQNLLTGEQILQFAVKSKGLFQLIVGNAQREGKFPAMFVDNHEYHHICVIWNLLTAVFRIYRDGTLVSSFSFTEVAFPPAAPSVSLVIGQSYIDNASKSFDPEKAFTGVITRFNVWNYELDDDEVNKISLVCGEEEGVIIAWPEVKLWTFDGLEVIERDDCFPENCLDYLLRNKTESGVYKIRPLKNESSFSVYCDQDTGSGGWLNIGGRDNGAVTFNDKTFKEFRDGFGDLSAEFWLGHQRIHLLTSAQVQDSLLTIKNEHNNLFSMRYEWFVLEREDADYKLRYSSPDGDVDQLLVGTSFVTSGRDSDHGCGVTYGPYWHRSDAACLKSNLFGLYGQGGQTGTQWMGQDSGKVNFWQWKIKSSQEFKRNQPVLYWTDSDSNWRSSETFCESKGERLCPGTDLCSPENDPFGAYLYDLKRTPVIDSVNKWLNIGETSSCAKVNPSDGSDEIKSSYKGRVMCCHGYPKRDWRYDLRFPQGSNGYVKMSSTAYINEFSICWWLRTPSFTQSSVTVFTLYLNDVKLGFSLLNDGTLRAELNDYYMYAAPSSIDGKWHHYCLCKHLGRFAGYYDGEEKYSVPLQSLSSITLNGGPLYIGQNVDLTGNIVAGEGLIGVLSRFNVWLQQLYPSEVEKFSKQCGGEVGDLVSWPEVKYYIVGDVELTSGTTCVKPDKHFWPFNVVNDEGIAYKDILGEYELRTNTGTSVEPGEVFTISDDSDFVRRYGMLHDCITDPGLCRTTGLTVGLWLKRKGLQSKILPESDEHYLTFLKWLDAAASSVSDWLICYNHMGPSMNIPAFHEGCDYVGATVTLLRVGEYVFGGFSNENWGGDARHIASHSSFLFSIHNPSNIGPVKFEVIADQNATALYTSNELGPTFGRNYDLKITSTQSTSSLGQTYGGIVQGSVVAPSFFTSTESFAVDQIEVFYAYVPSEAVGLGITGVIKDEQMTGSYYVLPKNGFQSARLRGSVAWKASSSDLSPWLQVKLNDVAKIRRIALQGCTNRWSEEIRLLFSMDEIYWTTYKEHFTEKVLRTGLDSLNEVKYITLDYAVEAKYVRISVVQFSGSFACMRAELYKEVQVCPSQNSPVVNCPAANGMAVTEDTCTSLGCCFINSQCVSKQQEIQDVGMESGLIPDESISVSSLRDDYRPASARFNSFFRGWESDVTDFPQWIQVELNQDETLTHIATRGIALFGEINYVKSYKLYYRKAFAPFVVYTENGQPRVFEGYPVTSFSNPTKHLFLNPFVARYVRLYPQQVPTNYIRFELYRAAKDSGTNVITTVHLIPGGRPTGISLKQDTFMQYRFAIQTDSAMWEVRWQWITYQWTHLIFSWNEQTGLHFYENGILMRHSESASQRTEARFQYISDKLIIGQNSKNIPTHIFDVANLFVLKRFVLPYEAKSLVYDVPCGFGDISQCLWNATAWNMTDSATPSNETGPEQGVRLRDSPNLALGKILLKTTETERNSSLAVDGLLSTCAVLNPPASANGWFVDLGELRKVGQVIIFGNPSHDPDKRIQYRVDVYSNFDLNMYTCQEDLDYYGEYETARSFRCNQLFDVNSVTIFDLDQSMPLNLCEVAVYTTASDKFAYMESSYPVNKSFSGVLTTTYFSQYNCLRFSYHMHGKHMGRLNVFGPDLIRGNRTLLWRIAGDQGNEWKTGVVRLEADTSQHFYEVTFEGIVGDGYTSDIALDNIVFSVDGQCSTYPPAAMPTISVASPEQDCLCLNSVQPSSSTLAVTMCDTLSQGLQWQPDGVLQLEEKCIRPADDDVIDGTKLMLSTSCDPEEVAFELTPSGAIQHLASLLCVQSAEVKNGVKEGDVLALGRHGCHDVKWSWTTILLKDTAEETYSKLNVLKLGVGEMTCGDYDGSVFRFIPANVNTIQPGAFVVSYNESTGTYRSATVDETNENKTSFVVSSSETDSGVASLENTTKTPHQPLRGSSILGTQATPTRILSEWLTNSGIFSEFWRPCVYRSDEGTSAFSCSLESDVPTLLLIRKDRELVGGYMAHKYSKPNGNFLFSLKESSSSKFNEAFGFQAGGVVLTENAMTFGNDELAINWSGEPEVENRPGSMFGISNALLGEEQFTANDFEVLQPRDEICSPRCKAKEVCDQITGRCICDSTDRPPAWCLTGPAGETIYADAEHYWSMDSKLNILDEKADDAGWALVEGDLKQNVGVNGPCVEVENNNGNIELLSDDKCFKKISVCQTGLTISFWFKNVNPEQSNVEDEIFLQTSYNVDAHTGFLMRHGNTPGKIVFESHFILKKCTSTFHIEPNLWTFVTLVKVGLKWEIYVNGARAKVVSDDCEDDSNVSNSNGKLILSNGRSGTSAMFDDVAVWYRELEEDEVEEIYRYYYKEPPTLAASLEVKFNQPFVSTNEVMDKESSEWRRVEEEIHTKFGAFFPGHEPTSFAVEKCRIESWNSICNVVLTLNGSDYEMVEKLEDEDAIPGLEIKNLKTKNVFYNATALEGISSEPSQINLTWPLELNKLYQGFLVNYVNNKTNETFNATVNRFASSYELYNLTGYSHYIIRFAFYTLAGVGKWTEIVVETEEDVPKYPPSNLTGHNASSTELFLTWDAVPEENTYERMRGYVVYVVDAATSVFVKNITTNSSTLDVHIDELRKFRTYSLYIRAFSIDVGVESITMNLTTSEDAPDAPPEDFQVFNSSSTSLRIEFDPVHPDLINGILRGYRVFYWKTREGNLTRKNFTITKEPGSNSVIHRRQKRSAGLYHEGYPLFADIYNLQEYTNYTVQIQAITILDGVMAPPFTTLTAEDLPSMAPPNVTARNTSSTSILLEWELIPEDDRNGIILGHVVYYTGRDGVEQTFVYKSSETFLDLPDLEKFTEYSFQLTVFNSIGESNRSEIVSCKTDQDRPDLPPQDIVGTPISPSTMGIVWKPVPFPFERGIILGYRFIFTTMSGEVLEDKVLPPEDQMIIVRDLHIFTNYTVNMTAFTIKGDGPWSSEVVLSLQIAPTIPPLNLTADSFHSLNNLPVHWIKVPPELTKGYILGYKLYIKPITVGLEKVPNARVTEVILKGQPSSYVFRDLDFFTKFQIYLTAFTVSGDSPRSNTVYAETCRCGPTLSTQWSNLAPYTNVTNPEYFDKKILKNNWGIFPYIVSDAVTFCCQTCASHNYSTVDFSQNYHGQPSELSSYEALLNSVDGLTDLTFPVYGYVGMSTFHSLYKYTPLIESPGSAFLIRKEERSMSGLLMSNILGNWPLAAIMVCLALAAGAVMWCLETTGNSEEFPPKVLKGILNGFWWAYVTMTTVGYGDRSPRTNLGRIFAIVWTLTGLIITGIMVGDLASSLTVSVTPVEKIIYGAKVGALDQSPEFRLGVRLNAKMNTVRAYQNLDELYKGLLSGEVDGILLDAYVVGSRKDLFKTPNILVNKIKDYRTAYGIVWAGKSSRMRVCLDWYMKSRKSMMFRHIAENLEMVKKIDEIDAQEELANLFDPTTSLYKKTFFICLVALGAVVAPGLIYECIRRRRLATKVEPRGENEMKNECVENMDNSVNQITSEIVERAQAMKTRHIQQLRAFKNRSWFKKSKVCPSTATESSEIDADVT